MIKIKRNRPNPTGHPARYSADIIDALARILLGAYPDWMGRPLVLDPCAGTGEALDDLRHLLASLDPIGVGFPVRGVEIEAPYIARPDIVRQGDSTDRALIERIRNEHPTGQMVVCTSVVYPNGVADSFIPKDASRRFTYITSLLRLTGDDDYRLHPNNQANYGYRGTKRVGRSRRRVAYWSIAERFLQAWARADMIVLNVSDYTHSDGEIEPVVADWANLLRRHGWADQQHIEVATPRMRQGKNHERRVESETIIVARPNPARLAAAIHHDSEGRGALETGITPPATA